MIVNYLYNIFVAAFEMMHLNTVCGGHKCNTLNIYTFNDVGMNYIEHLFLI